MPADNYTSTPDEPTGGNPILLRPSTFTRHEQAVRFAEQDNRALYPRSGRGRTTHPASGTWGFLASGHSISGASGLTLGTGTVQLCSRSGGTLTADGETGVPVLNPGGTISGPATLPLRWTDGAWAVCECGGTTTPATCALCGIGGIFTFPIHMTDSNASFTATWSSFLNRWNGSYTLTKTGVTSVASGGGGCNCTLGTCTISVGYNVRCIDNSGLGPVQLVVTRGWHIIYVDTDIFNTASCDQTKPPRYVDDSIALGTCCASPSNPDLGASSVTSAVDSCGPLSWSGTPVGISPLDPASGTVTLTQ